MHDVAFRKKSSILIVGAGGLAHGALLGFRRASPIEPPLQLTIVDGDLVELSNLNRQVLFAESDIGRPKAEALAERARPLLPDTITVRARNDYITVENLDSYLAESDIVLDATDDPRITFLLNDATVRAGLPFCYGGVSAWSGLVFVNGRSPGGACLRCLFGELSPEELAQRAQSCQANGVAGAFVGFVGTAMARETLRLAAGLGGDRSSLLRISGERLEVRRLDVAAQADCAMGCGARRQLDLSDQSCPMTFLYTKLALEQLGPRATLEVRFGNDTSAANVERSCAEEGYRVERLAGGDSRTLLIFTQRKHGGAR